MSKVTTTLRASAEPCVSGSGPRSFRFQPASWRFCSKLRCTELRSDLNGALGLLGRLQTGLSPEFGLRSEVLLGTEEQASLRGSLPGSAEEIWTGHRRISAAGDEGSVVRSGGGVGSGGPSPSALQELRTCRPSDVPVEKYFSPSMLQDPWRTLHPVTPEAAARRTS
ncbi:M-phase-specific PLK1-interacting protein isoform 1-T1 [Anableps anableps]